jgi:hypothetical protein
MTAPAAGVPVRIGNFSGFYGDRFSALAEMLDGGDLDFLTGDYLAELTMLILARDRARDPELGYARTFLRQLEGCLGRALERGVRIVTNAGGLNPPALAAAIGRLAERLGVQVSVGYVHGDDVRSPRFENSLAAHAYLGGWGIADCLRAGADVVVTGRVTDASLVLGPAAAHFGWRPADLDPLAGAAVAGHVIECGPQATGGNFAFFDTIPDLVRPGFPIAEIYADGSSVITKHPGTAGAVTTDTVTAQLLYEIGSARYPGPDVTARFDRIELAAAGPDRVRISGVVGEPPPPTYKVGLTRLAGFRNEVQFVLTGLHIADKAELVRAQLATAVPADAQWTLQRTDRPDADTEATASALLSCVVRGEDPDTVGRRFSDAAVQLALSSYPGFHLTSPPGPAQPSGVFEEAFVAVHTVEHRAVHPDGTVCVIGPGTAFQQLSDPVEPAVPDWSPAGPTARLALGTVAGARSGDKGGSANLGVWVPDPRAFGWLVRLLTVEELTRLLPELAGLPIRRYLLPNLHAVNFVIESLLGRGVAYQARFDPQAKALGEWLRSRFVDIPVELLP